MENTEKKKIGKKVGTIAEKMLILANKGAKRLEQYANKSAEENQNENARKLAAAMNKLSQKIEEKQEKYVSEVEKNANNLADKAEKIYAEFKNRVLAAKEKAKQDSNDKNEQA